MTKQLELGSRVSREPFGIGTIDQRREGDGWVQYHVIFEHVAAWFSARALTPVADAEPDADAVANLERAAQH